MRRVSAATIDVMRLEADTGHDEPGASDHDFVIVVF
jgi:hypothetical protein